MSVKVTIEATRKSDGMPWATFLIGGRDCRNYVHHYFPFINTENGRCERISRPEVKTLLKSVTSCLCHANCLKRAKLFIKNDDRKFRYFLQIGDW